MKGWTFTLMCFGIFVAVPAIGAVNSLHLPDGSLNSFFRIELSGALSEAAPEDINAITVTGPSGLLDYTIDDFTYTEITNVWRGFSLIVGGPPQRGDYEFTIKSGQTRITTYDTQGTSNTIPLPDTSTFSIRGNTFSWGLVDLPEADLYYVIQIDDADAPGKTVFFASSGKNGVSMNVPEGVLNPGQTYRWRVRVMDSPDWVSTQNESFSPYVTFIWAGLSNLIVTHREYGDGINNNYVQFQCKDESDQNVTRSISLSDVKVYDPNGQRVNLTAIAFRDLSVVTYNPQPGQWNYPPSAFDVYGYVYFTDPLIVGAYTIEVLHNGRVYTGTTHFNGFATLPFIDSSSFTLSADSNGDLTWSWTIPEGVCSGDLGVFTPAVIGVYSQGQPLGLFYFNVPNGQCISSLLLPASFVQTINAMGEEVRLYVYIRANDNNNDTQSLPLRLTQLAPPALAEIRGKITDAVTGEPIEGANISLKPGDITLTSQEDGTISSSEIPAGNYSAHITASNYNSKALSMISLSLGFSNQLNVSLIPYVPKVMPTSATPIEASNDGQRTTVLTARITHPLGLSSIATVLANLESIGGNAEQRFYDDGSHGDRTARDGIYSYEIVVPKGTRARLYALNVTAIDVAGKEGSNPISLNVKDKLSGALQSFQSVSQHFDNTLGGQTLNIHFEFMKAVSSLKALRSDCQVELTIYDPNGVQYGPYYGTDSIDVSIPNAPAGQWEYVTDNPCDSDLSYEVETSGSGTGLLVGRVLDGLTGLGVSGASIICNTGGSTVSLDQGYYSGVAVAGTGTVKTAKAGYLTNIKTGVQVKSGATTHLTIQVVPQDASAQAVPFGANVFHILDPTEDPNPPTQPFAAKVSGAGLELNAIFPRYQQAVDLYLALTPNSGEHAGKLFLIDQNNSFVEFTGPLHAWKAASTQEESGQIPMPSDFPYGGYTLYSLVTTDSSTLTNYDLSYFTTTPPKDAPVGQNVTFISSPTGDPDPLAQPLTAKVTGENLILKGHFPMQKEPVTIFLAYTTPSGELYLIKADGSRQVFTDTLWRWRENVTGEVETEVFSVPMSQLLPGLYYFYSLVTTDPDALSDYDLVYFSRNVTQ